MAMGGSVLKAFKTLSIQMVVGSFTIRKSILSKKTMWGAK